MSELVHRFADPGISTLHAVLDPVELGKNLCLVSSAQWGSLRSVRVQAVKHHGGSRCTVEIALLTESGWHELIGKVYATDRSDIYQVMEGIRRAGFGPEEEFSIPQPVIFLPTLRLLLQEKVPGPLATELFLTRSERDRAAAAERCARWLARFHSMAPKAGRVFDLNKHLISMERWSRRIAELSEPLAYKAEQLLRRLEVAAAALGAIEMCAGHGSYSHAQVILAERRTVALDWDGYDVADPSRDVGRFIVALQRLALGRLGSVRALDAAAEVFQSTYLATGRSEVEAHLPFYKAAMCLKLAKYIIIHPVPRGREKIQAMLDEGLRILEQ